MKSLLVLLSLSSLLASSALAAQNNIVIEYQTTKGQEDKSVQQLIEQSGVNETLVELSNAHFAFNETLTIRYGGEEGPMYDPETHTVHVPYSFVAESLQYFKKNDYQNEFGKEPQLGAIDTFLHTLLHEAGHALVADQNIPVLGKEEDAVDNFATLMMINYVEEGDDAAISAADMFAFESENRPDYYDFGEYIDEHSFDLQRYFSTLCLVYGSDPEKHQKLLDEVEKDYLSERKDFCIDNFQQLDHSWHQYLSSKN
ncbi:DUF4344 domain-containing metallopeptidase [Photobacterium sagamiensis]|uniref:DUF4344 domain-containing metallopeptidase n=1 Tax=Photobacterium sagamiensis TaxID=2910241 RepID=UPI003D1246C6